MILDNIENFGRYVCLHEKMIKALAFIKETDFSQLEIGKYEIENDNIFAIVQEYDTKNRNDCKLEGHYKYIDIQYIISGYERIGITTLTDQKPVLENLEADYAFYECNTNLIELSEGRFTIFFPSDLHMPGIMIDHSKRVKKIVIKVRI